MHLQQLSHKNRLICLIFIFILSFAKKVLVLLLFCCMAFRMTNGLINTQTLCRVLQMKFKRYYKNLMAVSPLGVDKIPARLLKETAYVLAVPPFILYDLSQLRRVKFLNYGNMQILLPFTRTVTEGR